MHPITIVASAALCAAAAAHQITITHQGQGAGNIGGVPFERTTFTIHALADTADVQDLGDLANGYHVVHQMSSIDIEGVGLFNFITPTQHFVNNDIDIVGFASAEFFIDLFNGPANPTFSTWDMTTSVGPIAGNAEILQWNADGVITDGGVLNMFGALTTAIFTANVAAGCPADCNDDAALNILDFVCFQLLFQTQAPEADCNDDGDFDILDFVCFQLLFTQGCN